MTELEAAAIINGSDLLRCVNCQNDRYVLAYWMLTPFPNPYGFYTYKSQSGLIGIAEKLQAEGTKT